MAIDAKNLVTAAKIYSRGIALPLDASEVYESLEAAQQYTTSPIAYAGQTIKALVNGKYETYVLDPEGDGLKLTKVGLDASAVKNYVQVVTTLPESNQEQGVVYINTTDRKGYIYDGTQFVTVFEQVDGLQGKLDAKADKADTLAGYGIKDAYTKTETDAAIATAIGKAEHLKRIIVETLPDVATADPNAIYMVPITAKAEGENKYNEYMLIDGAFEKIGDSAVDLSGYATIESVDTKIADVKSEAATDAQTKADAAKDAAIAAAKTDTAAQVATALQEAKTYADGKDAETLAAAKADIDTKLQPIQENLNTKVDAEFVAGKIGDIGENTVKQYVDTAVGSGGANVAEEILKAKQEAIDTAKTYTDSSLTMTEF